MKNNNYPIKSVLEQISTQIFQMNNLSEIQDYVVKFIGEHNVNDNDKQSIINNIRECKTVIKAQTCVCNMLLKYEGLSVNGRDKKVVSVSEVSE